MAHHAKHRRDLAAAELQARTQPTVRKHPKQALIAAAAARAVMVEDHPDPTVPSRPLDVPRIAVSQKPAANASYAACKDKFLQAMALNKSADFEATKFSPCSGAARQGKGNQEVGRRGRKTKGDCAAKVKKSAGEGGAVEKEESKVKASRDGIDAVKFASLSLEEKESRKGPEEGADGGRRNSTSSAVAVAAASGRRRRSFGGVEVELSDVFASSGVRVVAVDMPPFMQIHAVECARKASDSLEKFSCRALASTLKKEFDGVYGPAWHCIVGTSFGSFVTHSVGGFMYFSMDQKMYVLLFKTTVQRAD